MPTEPLSPKTVDALTLAGRHMHAHGVHPHSSPTHVMLEHVLAGYREAEAEAEAARAAACTRETSTFPLMNCHDLKAAEAERA